MSPGTVKCGSEARCRLWARPMPLSSMPPCHTGTPAAAQRSCTAIDSAWPPSRPGLMLTMRQAPERDRRGGVGAGVDRLVEADRRAQRALQRRVIDQVVLGERLLDHQQVEGVERGERGRVRQPVGGVGVDHQRQRRPAFADAGDDLGVPARLDLDLHALVAGLALDGDAIEQRLDRRLDADRHARTAPSAGVPPSTCCSGTPCCRA